MRAYESRQKSVDGCVKEVFLRRPHQPAKTHFTSKIFFQNVSIFMASVNHKNNNIYLKSKYSEIRTDDSEICNLPIV